MILGWIMLYSVLFKGIFCSLDEYCILEKFTATCSDGEVVVMTNATYGRMRLGKCITFEYNLGCSLDVLHIADRHCSGKQTCEFALLNEEFKSLRPCEIAELDSYLEASFTCKKVSSDNICEKEDSDKPGFLPGESVKCGHHLSPWVIKGSAGRRIHITLYDFTYSPENTPTTSCLPLGYITEDVVRSNKTICARSGKRTSMIYSSVSSEVQIQLLQGNQKRYDGSFLIGYKFVGCPDPVLSYNMWYKRDGDIAVVGCKDEDTEWTLECGNRNWKGNHKNCTLIASHSNEDKDEEASVNRLQALPESTIIGIIISVSVLVSGVILILGIVYAVNQRKYRKQPLETSTLPLTKDAVYTHNKKYGHTYGEAQINSMPSYNGSTYKPVQHANTCRRNRSAGNIMDDVTTQSRLPNRSFGNEATSWNYTNQKDATDSMSNDVEYESPYESRAPTSHAYFPLKTNSRPPAVNEI